MGNRRSGFKRLEEEHECTPASDWTKEEQESETKGKSVPEACDTEQSGPKLQQVKGAGNKKGSGKK